MRLPTKAWTDVLHQGHDRAFVVASATKDALLEDFQKAIDDSTAKGKPFKGWLDKDDTYHPGFLDEFDAIVKLHGWDHNGDRLWRARVIYETNLRSAHAAGRYKQMTSPATLKAFPYWQYVHAYERIPKTARASHKAWDGMVLRADDPWWDTYYPPNDWLCSCGVRTVSKAKLKRLGKDGPDTAPSVKYKITKDPATGELINYPKDVGMGWGYAPGQSWAQGLVPQELQRTATKQLDLPKLDNLPSMEAVACPIKAPVMEKGLPDQDYVKAFLGEFGAKPDTPKLFRDKTGHVVAVSDDLFKAPTGASKLNSSRAPAVLLLAEALKDPDEIWVDWEWHALKKKWILKRRYLRGAPNLAGMAIFEWSKEGWSGTTAYNAETGKKGKRKPYLKQIEVWRRGYLLYRREGEPKELEAQ